MCVYNFCSEQKALRTGTSTRLDERVFAMCEFKSQPLKQIMRTIHPDLYRIDNLTEQVTHTWLSDMFLGQNWGISFICTAYFQTRLVVLINALIIDIQYVPKVSILEMLVSLVTNFNIKALCTDNNLSKFRPVLH